MWCEDNPRGEKSIYPKPHHLEIFVARGQWSGVKFAKLGSFLGIGSSGSLLMDEINMVTS